MDALTNTSHCSNNYLKDLVKLSSDSLASLELFIDGVKNALNVALCSHCSFAHYNEWELDYLIKTTHFSPALKDHP
jgi:hypothetical protein